MTHQTPFYGNTQNVSRQKATFVTISNWSFQVGLWSQLLQRKPSYVELDSQVHCSGRHLCIQKVTTQPKSHYVKIKKRLKLYVHFSLTSQHLDITSVKWAWLLASFSASVHCIIIFSHYLAWSQPTILPSYSPTIQNRFVYVGACKQCGLEREKIFITWMASMVGSHLH